MPIEESEEDNELAEWIDSTFKRRVLYAIHSIDTLVRAVVLAVITTITLTLITFAVGDLGGSTLLWLAITIAIVIEGLDDLVGGVLFKLTSRISYHVFMAAGLLYYRLLHNRKKRPDVTEDRFTSWIEKIPFIGIFRGNNGRKLY